MTDSATVHIFAAAHQPATRFAIDLDGKRLWMRNKARALFRTWCCSRRRWAAYCVVQVYYDSVRSYCRPGHGCKKSAA